MELKRKLNLILILSKFFKREENVMNSNNLYFGSRLVRAIKLGFLIHDLAVFPKKRKKHNWEGFSQILAQ